MGFWIARADPSGAMIVASQLQLSPGPTSVTYPTDPAGSLLETIDGNVIQQVPNQDARRYVWTWTGYPYWQVGYQQVWDTLISLRSRNRKMFGASPFIYVKDDVSGRLRWLDVHNGTATGAGQTTTKLVDTSQAWTVNAFAGYDVEIISGTGQGQISTILSNTATALTLASTWASAPVAGSSVYSIHKYIDDWFQARVLEVSRQTQDNGGDPRYVSTRFAFVVEDPRYNTLGS